MRKLSIEGFQIEEKFTRYIDRVMEAAVNLELVSLLEVVPVCVVSFFHQLYIHGLTRREI
jgi:hypothetical protein